MYGRNEAGIAGGAAATAQRIQDTSAPPRASFLAMTSQEINTVRDQVYNASSRLSVLAERLFGSRPKAVGDGHAEKLDSSSATSAVESSVNQLRRSVETLYDEIERLEGL